MGISRTVFEQQVVSLLGSLNGVARRLTRNDADAEDLVAEAVAKAWRALATLESEAAFRGWMFRILHNTYVSDVRRASVRPRLEALSSDDAQEENDAQFSIFEQLHKPFLLWYSNPEQEYLDKLLRMDIDRALNSLPDHHCLVVVLADLEELSYSEIAQVLGVPIGTVRSRLARARAALQKRLWQQARECGLRTAASGCAHEGAAHGSAVAPGASASEHKQKGSV
jgi:RNA polymerase sigma-70 factor, ECF subfamily